MFKKLKDLESSLKNYKLGELNTNSDTVTSIVCPKYFCKDEYVELIN